jgi:hypothetical protein
MKKLLSAAAAVALSGLALLGRPVAGPPVAVAAADCRGDRHAAVVDAARLRAGAAIAAADGAALAFIGSGAIDRIAPADHAHGVIRHVSSRPGVGTAYVRDRKGNDIVVTMTAAGVHRFAAHGEALHPSLATDGSLVWAQGTGLRLVSPGADVPRRIQGPQPGGSTFSPLFDSDGVIVAGVAAPATRSVPEDEYVSNLWRYVSRSDRWVRLTHFAGGADRWSIVRTSFVARDGSIEFVRIHGRASQDRTPAFELWQLHGSVATQLRALPGEMYLAGFEGATRLWNVRDGATGAWRIEREGPDGSLTQVGCGAVAVDPLDLPDPDRRPGTRWASLSPTTRDAAAFPTDADTTDPVPAVEAILVGDFSTQAAAADAAASIRAAFGSTATVIDATQEPAVVRPGVWAVVVPIGSADPEADLTRFRSTMPELSGWSWIVSI